MKLQPRWCGTHDTINDLDVYCLVFQVSRHLFTWTKEIAYADYYERALTNGILGIQRGTDPGVMIYMYPLHPGGSKARGYHGWGTKFDSFWCCYGTGKKITNFCSVYYLSGCSQNITNECFIVYKIVRLLAV